MKKEFYNKNDIAKEMNYAIIASQNLYNIKSLNIWEKVENAGIEELNKYPDSIVLNQQEFIKACRNVLGAVYAAIDD